MYKTYSEDEIIDLLLDNQVKTAAEELKPKGKKPAPAAITEKPKPQPLPVEKPVKGEVNPYPGYPHKWAEQATVEDAVNAGYLKSITDDQLADKSLAGRIIIINDTPYVFVSSEEFKTKNTIDESVANIHPAADAIIKLLDSMLNESTEEVLPETEFSNVKPEASDSSIIQIDQELQDIWNRNSNIDPVGVKNYQAINAELKRIENTFSTISDPIPPNVWKKYIMLQESRKQLVDRSVPLADRVRYDKLIAERNKLITKAKETTPNILPKAKELSADAAFKQKIQLIINSYYPWLLDSLENLGRSTDVSQIKVEEQKGVPLLRAEANALYKKLDDYQESKNGFVISCANTAYNIIKDSLTHLISKVFYPEDLTQKSVNNKILTMLTLRNPPGRGLGSSGGGTSNAVDEEGYSVEGQKIRAERELRNPLNAWNNRIMKSLKDVPDITDKEALKDYKTRLWNDTDKLNDIFKKYHNNILGTVIKDVITPANSIKQEGLYDKIDPNALKPTGKRKQKHQITAEPTQAPIVEEEPIEALSPEKGLESQVQPDGSIEYTYYGEKLHPKTGEPELDPSTGEPKLVKKQFSSNDMVRTLLAPSLINWCVTEVSKSLPHIFGLGRVHGEELFTREDLLALAYNAALVAFGAYSHGQAGSSGTNDDGTPRAPKGMASYVIGRVKSVLRNYVNREINNREDKKSRIEMLARSFEQYNDAQNTHYSDEDTIQFIKEGITSAIAEKQIKRLVKDIQISIAENTNPEIPNIINTTKEEVTKNITSILDAQNLDIEEKDYVYNNVKNYIDNIFLYIEKGGNVPTLTTKDNYPPEVIIYKMVRGILLSQLSTFAAQYCGKSIKDISKVNNRIKSNYLGTALPKDIKSGNAASLDDINVSNLSKIREHSQQMSAGQMPLKPDQKEDDYSAKDIFSVDDANEETELEAKEDKYFEEADEINNISLLDKLNKIVLSNSSVKGDNLIVNYTMEGKPVQYTLSIKNFGIVAMNNLKGTVDERKILADYSEMLRLGNVKNFDVNSYVPKYGFDVANNFANAVMNAYQSLSKNEIYNAARNIYHAREVGLEETDKANVVAVNEENRDVVKYLDAVGDGTAYSANLDKLPHDVLYTLISGFGKTMQNEFNKGTLPKGDYYGIVLMNQYILKNGKCPASLSSESREGYESKSPLGIAGMNDPNLINRLRVEYYDPWLELAFKNLEF